MYGENRRQFLDTNNHSNFSSLAVTKLLDYKMVTTYFTTISLDQKHFLFQRYFVSLKTQQKSHQMSNKISLKVFHSQRNWLASHIDTRRRASYR